MLAIITDARGEEKSFPMLYDDEQEDYGKGRSTRANEGGKDLLPDVHACLTHSAAPDEDIDKRPNLAQA